MWNRSVQVDPFEIDSCMFPSDRNSQFLLRINCHVSIRDECNPQIVQLFKDACYRTYFGLVLVLRDQTCRRLDISCLVQDIETYYILIKSQLRKSSSNLVGVSCVWKRKIDCFTILFNCHLKSRFCKVCDVIDVVLVSLLFT